jgi:hypothetical protein
MSSHKRKAVAAADSKYGGDGNGDGNGSGGDAADAEAEAAAVVVVPAAKRAKATASAASSESKESALTPLASLEEALSLINTDNSEVLLRGTCNGQGGSTHSVSGMYRSDHLL